MKKYPLGVVLSGGSVRGMAHIGFLQRLEELGIKPSKISGTSSGALVGAFYAAGKSTKEVLDFFKTTPLFKYNAINPLKPGIFDTEKYIEVFRHFLPPTFEDLKIPITVCAVNVEKGEAEYFSSGDLYKPLLASSAIPFIFSPVKINKTLYIDGGVINNFPVEQLMDDCNVILGSYVGNPGTVTKKEINSVLKITNRANQLLMYASVKYKFNHTDLTLEYPLQKFGPFDQKKLDEINQIGYQYALKSLQAEVLRKINPLLLTK